MLHRITRFDDVDQRKLMDIYAESNLENTDYFFPDEKDKTKAVAMVEAGFLDFLKNDYFSHSESEYFVWSEKGVWVCAFRLFRAEDDLYYVCGLETHPSYRRQGYATKLIRAVQDELKGGGAYSMYSSVHKKNTASLKFHEKCGFSIVTDIGHDYYYGDDDENEYGLEYRYEC